MLFSFFEERRRKRWSLVRIESPLRQCRSFKNTRSAPEARGAYSENACYVDGAASHKGAGCAIYYKDGHYLNTRFRLVSTSANRNGMSNVAEIAAMSLALRRHPRDQELTIYTDSKATAFCLVKYMNGNFWCPFPAPAPILSLALCIALQFRTAPTTIITIPGHARIPGNDMADLLAKSARDEVVDEHTKPLSIHDQLLLPRTADLSLLPQNFNFFEATSWLAFIQAWLSYCILFFLFAAHTNFLLPLHEV